MQKRHKPYIELAFRVFTNCGRVIIKFYLSSINLPRPLTTLLDDIRSSTINKIFTISMRLAQVKDITFNDVKF